jgi:tRNA (cytidine32/uridine32-2'-O)-methyltransferase
MPGAVFTIATLFTSGNKRRTTVEFGNIRIVLVGTTHPGNIGATARAMKNMGLTQLWLVEPKHWPSREALSMAASALDILDHTRVVDTLEDAIADCHLVLGTSARLRDMPIPLLDPAACAATVVDSLPHKNIALVFGREASGLSNAELHLCHYHVHIPVNPECSSLNLAAAVMVLSYELRKAALARAGQGSPADKPHWDQAPATMYDMDLYLQHLEAVLIRLHFHDPSQPRPLMRRLRRLYQRIQPDKMELNILRGVLAATDAALDKVPADPDRQDGGGK